MHYRQSCWSCVYLTILISLQIGSLVVALAGVAGAWSVPGPPAPPESVPVVSPAEGHGNYCRVGETEYFLGRDLAHRGLRGYLGLERWCRDAGGTMAWKP